MLKNDYIIEYVSDIPCVKWAMKHESNPVYFKESIYEAIQLYEAYALGHKNLKLLFDMREMLPSPFIDMLWVNASIMANFNKKYGVKQIAIVVPASSKALDYFMQFYVGNERLQDICIFTEEHRAIHWLRYENILVGPRFF